MSDTKGSAELSFPSLCSGTDVPTEPRLPQSTGAGGNLKAPVKAGVTAGCGHGARAPAQTPPGGVPAGGRRGLWILSTLFVDVFIVRALGQVFLNHEMYGRS